MAQDKASPSGRGPDWFARLVRNVRLSWRLLRDPRVPTWAKLIPLAALAYVVIPADIVPDVLIGLGQTDDVGVLLLSLKLFIDLCPSEIVQRHLAEMTSVEAEYRVVPEDQPRPPQATGYLNAKASVPLPTTTNQNASGKERVLNTDWGINLTNCPK